MDDSHLFNAPIIDTIRQRFSCRMFHTRPIEATKQQDLQAFMDSLPAGPFGARPRFRLVAATKADRAVLHGLGTYGFIRGATGFIIGAVEPGGKYLEDYGYLMEAIILHATHLRLGTCWLGGTFTRSRFAKKIDLGSGETIPAVTAVGEFIDPEQARQGLISGGADAGSRLPWDTLFSDMQSGKPLDRATAGAYAMPLSMVRIAPSASNKQPWRVVKDGQRWHFYLQRTPGYRRDPLKILLDLCDLQRLDMGIALCHFELTAREMGLAGHWAVDEPLNLASGAKTEYVASWVID
ncbi:MAG: nitroreductase family protein [Anaerolineales bacterium]